MLAITINDDVSVLVKNHQYYSNSLFQKNP